MRSCKQLSLLLHSRYKLHSSCIQVAFKIQNYDHHTIVMMSDHHTIVMMFGCKKRTIRECTNVPRCANLSWQDVNLSLQDVNLSLQDVPKSRARSCVNSSTPKSTLRTHTAVLEPAPATAHASARAERCSQKTASAACLPIVHVCFKMVMKISVILHRGLAGLSRFAYLFRQSGIAFLTSPSANAL